MKKIKSSTRKSESVKFESEESVSDQFENLMTQSDVGALPKKTLLQKSKKALKKQGADNTVEFIEDPDWPEKLTKKSLKGKFAGQQKRPKKRLPVKKIAKDFQPDATIDLHGETQSSALIRVERFMQNSKARGCKSVLIITGRGKNSDGNRGVLKSTIWEWLKNQQNINSIRFQKAPDFLGGDGAVLVFI